MTMNDTTTDEEKLSAQRGIKKVYKKYLEIQKRNIEYVSVGQVVQDLYFLIPKSKERQNEKQKN